MYLKISGDIQGEWIAEGTGGTMMSQQDEA